MSEYNLYESDDPRPLDRPLEEGELQHFLDKKWKFTLYKRKTTLSLLKSQQSLRIENILERVTYLDNETKNLFYTFLHYLKENSDNDRNDEEIQSFSQQFARSFESTPTYEAQYALAQKWIVEYIHIQQTESDTTRNLVWAYLQNQVQSPHDALLAARRFIDKKKS